MQWHLLCKREVWFMHFCVGILEFRICNKKVVQSVLTCRMRLFRLAELLGSFDVVQPTWLECRRAVKGQGSQMLAVTASRNPNKAHLTLHVWWLWGASQNSVNSTAFCGLENPKHIPCVRTARRIWALQWKKKTRGKKWEGRGSRNQQETNPLMRRKILSF